MNESMVSFTFFTSHSNTQVFDLTELLRTEVELEVFRLPVDKVHRLQRLNRRAAKSDNQEHLLSYMVSCGIWAEDSKTAVSSVMANLMTDNLAAGLTWEKKARGQNTSTKVTIKDTYPDLYNVMKKVLERVSAERWSKQTLASEVRRYLKNAYSRMSNA